MAISMLGPIREVAVIVFMGLTFTAASPTSSNITIDDSSPDPLTGALIDYGPPGTTWNVGQNCPTCFAQPNPSQPFGGTWHDGTFLPGGPVLTASVSFTGTAVYVMSILVSVAPAEFASNLSSSPLTFQINGTNMGTFSNTTSAGSGMGFSYNIPVFVQERLPPGRHNLTIMNGGGSSKSLLLLDRIIYTTNMDNLQSTPQPSNSTGPSSNIGTGSLPLQSPGSDSSAPSSNAVVSEPLHHVGVIAGTVVASVLVVLSIATAWIWVLCRRTRRSRAAMLSSSPFQVADTIPGGNDDNLPDYESVVVEITNETGINNDASRTHLTSFGPAGTKELIARLAAASTPPRT